MLQLKVYDGSNLLRELRLGPEPVTVGREPGSTIVLEDPSVSRRHARIEASGNFHTLRDAGSTNGTFINDMLARAQVLSHGDVVRIGRYVIRVENAREGHDTTRVRVESFRIPGSKAAAATEPVSPPSDLEATGLDLTGRDRLLRLLELTKDIAYVDTVEALLDRALELILPELGADRGAVLFAEPGSANAFRPVAVRSRCKRPANVEDMRIPRDLLREASSRPLGALRPSGASPDLPRGPAFIACPLRERDRLRGLLHLERVDTTRPFVPEDLEFLSALAGLVAIGIANAELFGEVAIEKEKVRAIVASQTDAVILADRDFRILDANAATGALLGVELGLSVGSDFFALIGGYRSNPEHAALRRRGLRGETLFGLTGRRRGSAKVVIAGRILPYPRASKEPRGMLILLQDRTEADRVEDLKGRFLETISHKLRSPMTVIQSNLPILRRVEEHRPEAREILDELERSSLAVCHLLEQFAEYTDLESQSFEPWMEIETSRVEQILGEAVDTARSAGALKRLTVRLEMPRELPPVPGRREQLLRGFRQILDNSVKFCGEGGTIQVEAEAQDGVVTVRIADDGPGIPAADLDHVMLTCHQVDSERTGEIPGAGLGLPIARHIVERLGGALRVVSPHAFPDRGTLVRIDLPAMPEHAPDPAI